MSRFSFLSSLEGLLMMMASDLDAVLNAVAPFMKYGADLFGIDQLRFAAATLTVLATIGLGTTSRWAAKLSKFFGLLAFKVTKSGYKWATAPKPPSETGEMVLGLLDDQDAIWDEDARELCCDGLLVQLVAEADERKKLGYVKSLKAGPECKTPVAGLKKHDWPVVESKVKAIVKRIQDADEAERAAEAAERQRQKEEAAKVALRAALAAKMTAKGGWQPAFVPVAVNGR